MEQREPVIQVKNLYKIYRVGETKVRALNGVDFTIDRGTFCSIVGTSGSGKSTLLNMLAGLEKPTKGEIVIAGEHMETKTENQLVAFRREHIGFIFQSFNLLGTMNAIENVALPLTFQGMDKKKRNRKAEEMLELVGLTKHKLHKPNQMSGGQQQRVGVARALVVNPEIIFADEPTGNLDSNTSVEVMNLMKKVVREQNQTLVMVTHDNYLAGFADLILHIKDGKIVQIEDNRKKTEWNEEITIEKDITVKEDTVKADV
ncbi:MAG: ABC transporter ATP-binding protein [Lachnospiraceae bacterium]|nr:ABC transporter ATP-binding protein [Lachnospiraceae bacterium]